MPTHPPNESDNQEHIYFMLAGVTAILAELCELLVSGNVCTRTDIVNRLYTLRSKAAATPRNTSASAPISHLIQILETIHDTTSK